MRCTAFRKSLDFTSARSAIFFQPNQLPSTLL
jgi:hypothetical protein